MTRTRWLIPVAALLLAACTQQPMDSSPAGTETTAASSAAGTPQATLDFTGATPAGSPAATGPEPTVNPTSVAIAQTFEVPVRGSKDARVRIYTFSDYLCPFCGRFERETAAAVAKKYGPDEVAFVYWDFPIKSHGIMAVVAAEAAHCVEEQQAGKYWELHDLLFNSQTELEEIKPEDEKAAVSKAVELGKKVGADEGKLRECLESTRYRPIVGALQDQAMTRGVEMTPTLVLVSRGLTKNAQGQYDYGDPETALGALPMQDLDPYIQRSLKRSMGTSVPTPTEPPTSTPGPGTPTEPAASVAQATATP